MNATNVLQSEGMKIIDQSSRMILVQGEEAQRLKVESKF